MTDLEQLAERFVEDADSLGEAELAALVAALEREPALAERLRDGLAVDELLRQRLAADRGDFLAQIGQRVADHDRSEEAIEERTAELRRLAMGQLGVPARPATERASRILWASLASLLLAAAAAALSGVFHGDRPIAHVDRLTGEVTVVRGGQRRPLEAAGGLSPGDVLELAPQAATTIAYADGTTVDLAGDSIVEFESSQAKQILLSRGELTASIAPQPDEHPMTFRTPAAEATVVGTRLSLRALADSTELEVSEGAVEFRNSGASASQLVAARQFAVAASDKLAVLSTAWPLDRRRLVLLAPRGAGELLFRDANTGSWKLFDGGGHATQASDDLLLLCQRSGEFSIEVIFQGEATQAGATLVAFGKEAAINFQLIQNDDWLTWRMRSKSGDVEVRLAPVEPGGMNHLVVVAAGDGLQAFQNGKAVFDSDDGAAIAAWTPGALRFAGDSGAQPIGEIHGVAIYDRALSAEEALASSRRMPAEPLAE